MERKDLLLGLGLIVLAAAIGAGCTNTSAPGGSAAPTQTVAPTQGTLPPLATLAPADALAAATSGIQAALDRIDRSTADAAAALGPTDMTGNETRRILRDLSRASPAVIDATAVSKDGVMLTVMPVEYSRYEGSDIADQAQVRRVRETHKPAMSGVFRTVEGVNATDLEHPVFAPSGQFNGSASLLFRPTVLITLAMQEALGGKSAEVFVVDTDGVVLYDRDTSEIGQNTFTDAKYSGNTELLAIADRMRTEDRGTGSYTFAAEGSSAQVRKTISWDSVELYGTEWRVVAVTSTTPV